MTLKTVLTIAGSDSSGGAGIQADIKTITMHGLYAMSVVTALTAQNTREVSGILPTPAEFVGAQLDAVFTDIFPDAVKIGMLPNTEVIETVAEKLIQYGARNVVLDPVMVATSGGRLMRDEAVDTLTARLFPLAAVVTPNIPEAEALTGMPVIRDEAAMAAAAEKLSRLYGCAALVKGGHLPDRAELADILAYEGKLCRIPARRVDTANTHGTGCTLSSAIACGLAQPLSLADSVKAAKAYLQRALEADLTLGHGSGPLAHNFSLL